MYISWSEFLSLFLWRFLLLFGYNYCDWLYVYRCVCWSAVLYFCFCLPLSEYIIGSLHVCQQARSARLVCIIAIDNVFFIFLFCVHTSLDFSFFLFICLWMSVPLSSCIKLWLMVSAYTSLLRVSNPFSLNIRISLRRLYCDSLDMYVSWSVFLSVFSLNASTGFRQYYYWLSVYSFVSCCAFLSMFLSICLTIGVYYR